MDGAADTRRAANGGTVKVTNLRKQVRHDESKFNNAAQVNMVKAKDLTGGARVYATNPWTRQTVSYTVRASGRKVVVRKN